MKTEKEIKPTGESRQIERQEQPEWRYVETQYAAEVHVGDGDVLLRPHWKGFIVPNELRAVVRKAAAAPALYRALREVRRAYNQGPDARSIRIAMDSAIDHVDAALSLVAGKATEEKKS